MQQGTRRAGRMRPRKDAVPLWPRISLWPVSRWAASVGHVTSPILGFLPCKVVKNDVYQMGLL